GGENDGRHGGAESEVKDTVRGEVLGSKNKGKHGDDDQSAPYAQQAGKEADYGAQYQVYRPPLHVKPYRRRYQDAKLYNGCPTWKSSGGLSLQNSHDEIPL